MSLEWVRYGGSRGGCGRKQEQGENETEKGGDGDTDVWVTEGRDEERKIRKRERNEKSASQRKTAQRRANLLNSPSPRLPDMPTYRLIEQDRTGYVQLHPTQRIILSTPHYCSFCRHIPSTLFILACQVDLDFVCVCVHFTETKGSQKGRQGRSASVSCQHPKGIYLRPLQHQHNKQPKKTSHITYVHEQTRLHSRTNATNQPTRSPWGDLEEGRKEGWKEEKKQKQTKNNKPWQASTRALLPLLVDDDIVWMLCSYFLPLHRIFHRYFTIPTRFLFLFESTRQDEEPKMKPTHPQSRALHVRIEHGLCIFPSSLQAPFLFQYFSVAFI